MVATERELSIEKGKRIEATLYLVRRHHYMPVSYSYNLIFIMLLFIYYLHHYFKFMIMIFFNFSWHAFLHTVYLSAFNFVAFLTFLYYPQYRHFLSYRNTCIYFPLSKPISLQTFHLFLIFFSNYYLPFLLSFLLHLLYIFFLLF